MSHDELWYIKPFYANTAKNDTHSHTKGTMLDRTILSVSTHEILLDELEPTSIVSLCLGFSWA